ncbi:hypothetical protein [Ligilactobacillus sp. LYQ60]|uniref:hypothetical protein n=1 Tax=Ligilactobacillus sp. LYQ60 TaxID=3378799 RepID=UPI003854023C
MKNDSLPVGTVVILKHDYYFREYIIMSNDGEEYTLCRYARKAITNMTRKVRKTTIGAICSLGRKE